MVYFACGNAAATRRMLTVVLAVSAAVVALTVLLVADLALAGASAGQGPARDVRGTVVVPFGASSDPVSCGLTLEQALEVLGGETTEPCPLGALGGYSDVADGTVVEVTDAAGNVLATAPLVGGVAEGGTVTFAFELPDVPDADSYGFQVNARGVVPVDRDRLARDGWEVVLDLR